MEISSDRRKRRMSAWIDLPDHTRAAFDYLELHEHHTPRFVRYHNAWYDTHNKQLIRVRPKQKTLDVVVDESNPLSTWDAVLTETYVSGVLFRFVDDDFVICGRYNA